MADAEEATIEDRRPWFDHVAFAVPDIAGPARLVEKGLGGELLRGADHPTYGFRSVQYKVGGGVKLELLMPLEDESGASLRRHLDERGPGVHHLTFLTTDVVATEGHLVDCGWRTSDSDFTDPRWRETYLGPRQGLGTVIQLVDSIFDWSHADEGVDLTEILSGMRQWHRSRSVLKSELSAAE